MKSALLVMDVLNELIDPANILAQDGFSEHAQKIKIISNLKMAIEYARTNGIKIIFVKIGFSDSYDELPQHSLLFKKLRSEGILKLSENGCQFPSEISPIDGEIIISKNRISPFYGTNLDLILRANNIENIYLSGIATEYVILSTCFSAHDLDYKVNVISDCTSSSSNENYVAAMRIIEKIAITQSVSEFIRSKK